MFLSMFLLLILRLEKCVSHNVTSGINLYVSNFLCLHFALSDDGVLNSLEELCITRVASVKFLRQSVHSLTLSALKKIYLRKSLFLSLIYFQPPLSPPLSLSLFFIFIFSLTLSLSHSFRRMKLYLKRSFFSL